MDTSFLSAFVLSAHAHARINTLLTFRCFRDNRLATRGIEASFATSSSSNAILAQERLRIVGKAERYSASSEHLAKETASSSSVWILLVHFLMHAIDKGRKDNV